MAQPLADIDPAEKSRLPMARHIDVPSGQIADVVTALEMLAPPPPRPEPVDARWSLERIERPELNWYRSLFRRVGEDWLWYSRLQLTDEALAAVVHDPQVDVRVLHGSDRDVGLLELDFRQPGECELAFLGLTSAMQGQGAGRWLMNRALELAWSRPIRRFWVHTSSLDHPAALDFYVRSGFKPYRRWVEIDADPRSVGLLPRTAAPQIPLIE